MIKLCAWVAKLVDAQDLKSCGSQIPCRFKSGLRHHNGEIPKSGWRDRSWKPAGRKRRGGSNPSFSAILIIIDIAGWSSLVARWAHNPKVVGSNPAPATKWFRGVAVITSACHAEDREFDSRRNRHFFWLYSSVGRAQDWKSWCRWFNSTWSHHLKFKAGYSGFSF